jgi:hypothetical protein
MCPSTTDRVIQARALDARVIKDILIAEVEALRTACAPFSDACAPLPGASRRDDWNRAVSGVVAEDRDIRINGCTFASHLCLSNCRS